MTGREEPTRVFRAPAAAAGSRRARRRAPAGRRPSREGNRRAVTRFNPFARPGLLLAVAALLFLVGAVLGFVLGLRGH